MPSKPFGEHLKREREMRGVSLEEIAAATRIAPRFLAALESEQWDSLPGGVFNRGFIRSVARYLGLDEDTLVAEYALETKGRPDPGVVADPPEEPDRNWARVFVLIIFALAILGAGWAAFHFLGPKIAARLHKHSGEPVNSAPGTAGSGSPSIAATSAPIPPATATDPATGIPANAAGSSSVGDPSTPAATPALDLKLATAKTADVKVAADGKIVYEGHMDAGQVYRFAAADSLEVTSSDSSAILLELNGQSVSAGGQSGQPGDVTFTQKDVKPVAGDPH
jgi:cytoskeleton protein RodZ